MSPEKVAILVVAGLIAVLLGVALLGTESNGSGSGASPAKTAALPEKPKPAFKQIESYTYEDILKGAGRTRVEAKPAPPAETRPAGETIEYTVRKDDTIEKIARRELGNRDQVAKILALNKGVNPSKLQIGAKLRLPVVKQDPRLAEAAKAKAKTPALSAKGRKNEPVAAKSGKSL